MTYELAVIKLEKLTDKRLAELLLSEKDKPGWTSSRAVYLIALKHVVMSRGISQG